MWVQQKAIETDLKGGNSNEKDCIVPIGCSMDIFGAGRMFRRKIHRMDKTYKDSDTDTDP